MMTGVIDGVGLGVVGSLMVGRRFVTFIGDSRGGN